MLKTAFFDIDTQMDFMLPSGALYAPGAERLAGNLERLNRYAVGHGIPLISTMDAHAENDAEFSAWPPHCVQGTLGQRKMPVTLACECPAVVASRTCDALPLGATQILIEKQNVDCFTNRNLAGLVEALGIERCVVYGLVTEVCVRIAAFGLLKPGRRVEVVADAIRHFHAAAGERTLDDLRRAGARLVTTAEACSMLD